VPPVSVSVGMGYPPGTLTDVAVGRPSNMSVYPGYGVPQRPTGK
jgi:hypothetical protein